MTVDWNKPDVDDLVANVLAFLNEKISHAAQMSFGSDTNLPVGTIRVNPSNFRPEKWDGSSWAQLSWITDIINHMADISLHSAMPTGALIQWAGLVSPPPSGYLVCDGTAVSRSTYSALHTIMQNASYPYGAGDGSTTFNLPDFRGRSPLGKAASGTGSTLGGAIGSLDHTHSVPAHSHAIAAHTHAIDHTHTGGSHLHAQTAHTHNAPGHYHDTQGAGATINVTSSGAHQHDIPANSTGQSGTANRLQQSNTASIDSVTSSNTGTPNHTHPHANVVGSVGNVSGGVNGDASHATDTGTSGSVNTASGGAVATSQITTNVSGTGVNSSSVALNTQTDGSSTSGTNNHACRAVHFLIKT